MAPNTEAEIEAETEAETETKTGTKTKTERTAELKPILASSGETIELIEVRLTTTTELLLLVQASQLSLLATHIQLYRLSFFSGPTSGASGQIVVFSGLSYI